MEFVVNESLENSRLKELCEGRKQAQSPEEKKQATSAFLREVILNARFLSIVELSQPPVRTNDGRLSLPEGASIGFAMLDTEEGGQYYPVFTDWDEVNRWPGLKDAHPQTMILSFDDYAAMIAGKQEAAGLVINPFGDSFAIDREGIETLQDKKQLLITGQARHRVGKDTPILLGDPDVYPVEMINAICDRVCMNPNIHALWMRVMERDEEESYLIVADYTGSQEVVFSQIAEAAIPFLGRMYIDLLPLSDPFAREAVEHTYPFYEAES
ncbi:MAG: enhanced serine sensitivity protein SseB [Lachnospiraceae bacterium]|jgi:hypothetical protein|nr:enhanced serine sensitivity protein SseB [Lachnospiraceae bacterium]